MITTRLDSGRVVLHNGDYSGGVIINCTPAEVETTDFGPEGAVSQVTIPFEDLKEIVACYIRSRATAAIENADTDDLLFARVTLRD